MQREYDCPGATGRGRKPFLNAGNLGHARQEDEDMTARAGIIELFFNDRDQRFGTGRLVDRPIVDNYGMRSPFGPDNRAIVEKSRDRLGVERGGHDNQNQVGTNLAADLAQAVPAPGRRSSSAHEIRRE